MRNYFAMVTDGKNHTTYYLFSSDHRKGTFGNRFDALQAIERKTGSYPKWYNDPGKTLPHDYIYLDTPKNRDEQMVEENETSTIIDCR